MRFGLALLTLFFVFGCRTTGSAPSTLKDGNDDSWVLLDYKTYQVRFTNPLCKQYNYSSPIPSADGKTQLTGKPKNVFCAGDDYGPSGEREISPQHNFIKWLQPLGKGDEVFLAYLSFSNTPVANELCAAAKRGVKVTFVLDGPTEKGDQIKACGATLLYRGHSGGIGYAHNKILLVNPKSTGPGDADPDYMRMVFSSGNMSSGIVMHHENWHFVEVKRNTFFPEAHKCLMEAQISESHSSSKAKYRSFMNSCRKKISAPQEQDIFPFFIPNQEDSRMITDWLVWGIENSETVDIAAHRFSYTTMVSALINRLESDSDFKVRLVADDDLYWLRPITGAAGEQVGDNAEFEANNVANLQKAGPNGRFEIKFMETNHDRHILHHNKFIIMKGMPDYPDAVICGAANFTGTGYWTNFENIYWVQIPHVVQEFKKQYARFWDGEKQPGDTQDPPAATAAKDMPEKNVFPEGL
jgi:hypothetical protein